MQSDGIIRSAKYKAECKGKQNARLCVQCHCESKYGAPPVRRTCHCASCAHCDSAHASSPSCTAPDQRQISLTPRLRAAHLGPHATPCAQLHRNFFGAFPCVVATMALTLPGSELSEDFYPPLTLLEYSLEVLVPSLGSGGSEAQHQSKGFTSSLSSALALAF